MAQLLEFAVKHPLLVGATLLMLIAVVLYELRLRSRSGTAVSPHEAVRLMNQGATVVDLRDAARFAARHIVDAVNVSPEDLRADPESRLKKKRPAIIVCESGYHSARLANALRKAGFDKAWSLDGGIAAWEKENLPMVSARSRS
jgi:rhodanese-related sulfurtransferase